MKYLDLTRTITQDIQQWPCDPPLKLEQTVSQGFIVDNILQTGMHLGTHIDAPGHMIMGGKTLLAYSPETFIGRGALIDARGKKEIDLDLLAQVSIQPRDILLILTDSDEKYGTPAYFQDYPAFTEAFAKKLIELNVKIVGMDSPSPDYMPFPIHTTLLSHDVLIIEMMTNLKSLLGVKAFEVIALPPKFDTAGSFVRALAKIDSSSNNMQ